MSELALPHLEAVLLEPVETNIVHFFENCIPIILRQRQWQQILIERKLQVNIFTCDMRYIIFTAGVYRAIFSR